MQTMLTPKVAQYRMPAEWAEHEYCLMSWPSNMNLWGKYYDEICREYARVANTIAAFEPVLMVANPGSSEQVKRLCDNSVRVVEFPLNDSWIRDNGPIIVQDEAGQRLGLHFRFNAWGEKFPPFDKDAALPEPLLEYLGIPRRVSPMILEGGAIAVDGEGTLITTEQCLLNKNRNPSWTKEQIEAELKIQLGIDKVIWLPYGHYFDAHTDGHVDGILAYLRPGVVLVQTQNNPNHPDYERLGKNLELLRNTTDAKGRRLEIIELPIYPEFEIDGTHDAICYANLYIANGGVIVPTGGIEEDHEALRLIGAAMPGYEVVGVPARLIAYGGGGPHCITQQVPKGLL
jgi:agmatine deiminase